MTKHDNGAVRADMAEGGLWLETPQTAAATTALHRILDVARSDDPGWQPIWVLCGPPGTGKSAVARRFAAQARRAAACDAVAEVERQYAGELATPRVPSPQRFAERDAAWRAYRAALSAEERTARFGCCPAICRPVEYLPESAYQSALARARNAEPVSFGRVCALPFGVLEGMSLSTPGNEANDPLRRTSIMLIDDAERLVRLTRSKRVQAMDEIVEFPQLFHLQQKVTVVLVGSPELAAAVSEYGAVRLVQLPAMPMDAGFAAVCRLVFGDVGPDDIAQLHAASGGAMGPLLTLAYLRGLRPPYAIPEGEILRLPAPDR